MLIRGSKAILIDDQDHILIVRRSKTHPYVPLTLDIPGGQVEEGESMIDGLVREIFEETAIVVDPSQPRLLGTKDVTGYFGKDYYIELFEVAVGPRPNVTLDYEHDSFEWVPVKNAHILGELYEPMFNEYKARL